MSSSAPPCAEKSLIWLVRSCRAVILVGLFLCSFQMAWGQATEDYAAERKRAFVLYDGKNFSEAVPLLQNLVASKPEDIGALLRLATALSYHAGTMKDAEAARNQRLRARQIVLRAQLLGASKRWVRLLLLELPEDGHLGGFSPVREADQAMREGEVAFKNKDYAGALGLYRAATTLDPQCDYAAQFAGDVYFHWGNYEQAIEWYSRAATIDPDRETPLRYWGDALLNLSKLDEARLKYFDGLIADPYSEHSWDGLKSWAKIKKVSLSHPHFDLPASASQEGGKTSIVISPEATGKNDATYIWLMYGGTRALWMKERFAKEFPREPVYRHTLREEADALGEVAQVASSDEKSRSIASHDPGLAALLKLRDEGLLEAYILLARADTGIREDYEGYRDAHRDKLQMYLAEYVAPMKK